MGCCSSQYTSLGEYSVHYVSLEDTETPLTHVKPPTTRQSELLKQRGNRQKIEKHVLKPLPKWLLPEDYNAIGRYLTRKCAKNNIVEQLWALYVWVTDLKSTGKSKLEDEEVMLPMPLLTTDFKVEDTLYAHLFAALCRGLGIRCVIITGYTKNAEYVLGDHVNEDMKSQWNAVLFDDEWHFVDTVWGSRSVIKKRFQNWIVMDAGGQIIDQKETSKNKKESKFRDFYFLTDPEVFICTHLPLSTNWQLFEDEKFVSEQDFTLGPYVRERYFELECNIFAPTELRSHATNGNHTIQLNLPEDKGKTYDFTYLLSKNKLTCHSISRVEFQGIVFLNNKKREENVLEYDLRFPCKGKFRFDIFGADTKYPKPQFDLVASFIIISDARSPDFVPLPEISDIGWGLPNAKGDKYGLKAIEHSSDSGRIDTEDGLCTIRLSMNKGTQLTVGVELLYKHKKPYELEQRILARVDRTPNGPELRVDTRLKEKGCYVVKIYVGKEAARKLCNVANYIVQNKDTTDLSRFPYVHNSVLGVQKYTCEAYKIHSLQLTKNEIVPKKVEYVVDDPGVTLLAYMDGPGIREKCCAEYAKQDKLVSFDVSLKDTHKHLQCNLYSLNIFASQQGKSLFHVQSLLLKYDENSQYSDVDNLECTQDNELLVLEYNQGKGKENELEIECTQDFRPLEESCKELTMEHATMEKYMYREYLKNIQEFKDSLNKNHICRVNIFEQLKPATPTTSDSSESESDSHNIVLVKKYVKEKIDTSTGKILPRPFNAIAMLVRLKVILSLEKGAVLPFADAAVMRCNQHKDVPLYDNVKRLTRIRQLQRDFCSTVLGNNKQCIGELDELLEDVEAIAEERQRFSSEPLDQQLHKELDALLVVGKIFMLKKLKKKTDDIDQRTMAEMKAYDHPPKGTEEVFKATLILIEGDRITNWTEIRNKFNDSQKMKDKMKQLNAKDVSEDDANTAQNEVKSLTPEIAHRISDVVYICYLWVRYIVMLNEIMRRSTDADESSEQGAGADELVPFSLDE